MALAGPVISVSRASGPVVSALRYHPLVLVFIAFSLGVVLDRYAVPQTGLRGVVGALVVSLIAWCAWYVGYRRQRVAMASSALLVSIATLAGAWHHLQWSLYGTNEIALVASPEFTPVVIEAVAQHAPRFLPAAKYDPLNPVSRGAQSRFTARVTAVRSGRIWRAATGRVTARVDGHLLGIQAGDRLRVCGQLIASSPPLNPGEFDFATHQRTERILSHLWIDHPAAVERLGSGLPDRWLNWLDGSRVRAQWLLHQFLDGETRDLADALILGQRDQLTYAQNDLYFRSGMIHLLSVSGVHVAVLAVGLLSALRLGWLRRRTAYLGVSLLTVCYALLIDAEPPAIRATVIVVVTCSALQLGRDARPFNALAAAAIFVLAMNPAELFRTGTQLSFLAAMVLAYLARFELQRIERDPLDELIAATRPWPTRALRQLTTAFGQGVLVSFVIWIVSLPLIVHRFHIATPIALFLTPLLAVPITIALLSGFALLAAAVFVPPLAPGMAWCFTSCVALIDRAIAWGLAIPGNHSWLPGANLWVVLFFYTVVCGAVLVSSWQRRPRADFAAVTFASFLTLVIPQQLLPGQEGHLRCTFLAVGHGCSVLIELPDRRKLLYDAGHLGPPIYGAQSIAGALFQRGVRELDSIIISHADVDHYNAVPELLERLRVRQVWLSQRFRADGSAATQTLLNALERHRVPSAELSAGDRLWVDSNCSLRVLHPPAAGLAGSDNANSIVLLIEYRGRRILLTGDLESPGLERLLQLPNLDVDVLLAPHHGSARSNPPGCAAWCRPEWVVISGGRGAQPEVRQTYEQHGAQVFHTAVDGAVTFLLDERTLRVETFRRGSLGP